MFFSLNSVRVLSPAKVNLFLKVGSKYHDKYHKLYSLTSLISLFDSLLFTFQRKAKFIVECDDKKIKKNIFNIVLKSIFLFFQKLKERGLFIRCGINVKIRKKIPIGSGFGGGSSNAASTLLLLNEQFGYPFSIQDLLSIATEIGSDVPFFIFGKIAISTGIGNELEYFSFKIPKFALVVYPNIIIRSMLAYNNLDFSKNLRLTKKKRKSRDLGRTNCSTHFSNDLDIIKNEFPEIERIEKHLFELGAHFVLVSGSGSAVFGLFGGFKEAVLSWKILFNFYKNKKNTYLTEVVNLLFTRLLL